MTVRPPIRRGPGPAGAGHGGTGRGVFDRNGDGAGDGGRPVAEGGGETVAGAIGAQGRIGPAARGQDDPAGASTERPSRAARTEIRPRATVNRYGLEFELLGHVQAGGFQEGEGFQDGRGLAGSRVDSAGPSRDGRQSKNRGRSPGWHGATAADKHRGDESGVCRCEIRGPDRFMGEIATALPGGQDLLARLGQALEEDNRGPRDGRRRSPRPSRPPRHRRRPRRPCPACDQHSRLREAA